MSRSRQPRADYSEHDGYPSAQEAGLHRRAFLRVALASSATVAGSLAATRSAWGTPTKHKRNRVSVRLTHHDHMVAGTRLRATRLDVFTGDGKLTRFLRQQKNARAISAAMVKRFKKVTPKTLESGHKIYRLERDLARIVARVYRKKTKRTIAAPDVMLHVTRWRRRIRMLGGVGSFP